MPPKGSKNKDKEEPNEAPEEIPSTSAQQRPATRGKQYKDGDNMAEHVADEPLMPNSAELLDAIKMCQSTLTQKIDNMEVNLGLLRRDLSKIRERTKELEQRTSDLEDTMQTHRIAIPAIQQRLSHLEHRAVDAENRNRRNNLRILGLPEKAEGSDMVSFLGNLLKQLLPDSTFSPFFVIERAHRIATKKNPPGGLPRPVIFKLLNFRDRDAILSAAREAGELIFQNTKLMIFPDYTEETQRQRRSFQQVKTKLREKKITYAMLFPAKLRVQEHPLL